MKPEALSFVVGEGIRLAADGFGSAKNPPVVLLHGGGQTRHSWRETATALAESDWYAVSVDARGHGDSEWSPSGDYHHTNFMDDVVQVARAFEQPPALVGASLGGISALLAISSVGPDEALASALVLVDIATQMEADGAARIIAFMGSRPEGFASVEEAAEAVASYNPHRKSPGNLAGLAKNLRKQPNGRYRWHWDPAFIERRDESPEDRIHDADLLENAARSLTLPTLLVRGRLSDLLSQQGADLFLEQVPHASFADVSGAGHMVAGDQNDAFSEAVRSFLSAQR